MIHRQKVMSGKDATKQKERMKETEGGATEKKRKSSVYERGPSRRGKRGAFVVASDQHWFFWGGRPSGKGPARNCTRKCAVMPRRGASCVTSFGGCPRGS